MKVGGRQWWRTKVRAPNDLQTGIGGASRLRPSPTTVRTGPYTAVRRVKHAEGPDGEDLVGCNIEIGIAGNPSP